MEFIKKHWIKIVIGLLIIFSLNKCTVACNRDTMINKQAVELAQKDSIIKVQSDSLNILKIRWNDAQNSQNTYQGIALGNQNTLINEIESLNNVINAYNNQVNSLQSEYNKVKKENQQLKQQVQQLNNK